MDETATIASWRGPETTRLTEVQEPTSVSEALERTPSLGVKARCSDRQRLARHEAVERLDELEMQTLGPREIVGDAGSAQLAVLLESA